MSTAEQADVFKRQRECAEQLQEASKLAAELRDEYECDRNMNKKLKTIEDTLKQVSEQVDESAEDATGSTIAARAFNARRVAENVAKRNSDMMGGDSEQSSAKKRGALTDLSNTNSAPPYRQNTTKSAAGNSKQTTKASKKQHTPVAPPPGGRKMYTPREAAKLVAESPNAAATKSELISKKYVPCAGTQLHNYSKKWPKKRTPSP